MNTEHTEWVTNPKSNRLIKVGGPTWRKLVKEGKVSGVVKTMIPEVKKDPVTVPEPIDLPHVEVGEPDEVVRILNTQNRNPPPQKGKKQNRLAHVEITEMSTTAAIDIIKQNSSVLAEELEDIAYEEDEDIYNQRMSKFHKDVEQMIYQQLLSKKEVPRLKKEIDYDTEYSLIDQNV